MLKLLRLAAAALVVCGGLLHAQQIDWGSAIYSDFIDSEGAVLDETFVFQIGAFDDGFDPEASGPQDWLEHWQIFDQANYNGVEEPVDDGIWGYFISTANMEPDGTSDSVYETPGATSFEGKRAYLWIRNADTPEPGTEWLLVSSESWVFPDAEPGCCGSSLPFEWSTSDLDGEDTPLWGSQGTSRGPGEYSSSAPHTLQTHSFAESIPEPAAPLLGGVALLICAVRRKRMA